LKALRNAGPTPRPHASGRPLMRHPARTAPETVTEEWHTGPGRRPVGATRAAQPWRPSPELDQVVDLTEAPTFVRSDVGG
jgi:hypothetical protein